MKRLNITVNGKVYDVTVEEAGGSAPVQTAPAPAAAPAAAPAPVQEVPAPAAPAEGQTAIKAPMPGNILGIKVGVGDSVTENQPVIILEAMKMENDIVTPKSGKVAAVNVKKGDSVQTGDVLIIINS